MREEPTRVRAVIADDDRFARRQLRTCSRRAWIVIAGETGDGASTVRTVNAVRPDLLFLDIRMPEGDGTRGPPPARSSSTRHFTTAFDRYAVAAFEVQALDYLLKPFGAKRLGQALDRVRQQIGGNAETLARTIRGGDRAPPAASPPLRPSGGESFPWPVEKILHWRSQGRLRRAAHGRRVLRREHVGSSTWRSGSARSPSCVIHRSRIVNLEAVQAFERHDDKRVRARLTNGTTVVRQPGLVERAAGRGDITALASRRRHTGVIEGSTSLVGVIVASAPHLRDPDDLG